MLSFKDNVPFVSDSLYHFLQDNKDISLECKLRQLNWYHRNRVSKRFKRKVDKYNARQTLKNVLLMQYLFEKRCLFHGSIDCICKFEKEHNFLTQTYGNNVSEMGALVMSRVPDREKLRSVMFFLSNFMNFDDWFLYYILFTELSLKEFVHLFHETTSETDTIRMCDSFILTFVKRARYKAVAQVPYLNRDSRKSTILKPLSLALQSYIDQAPHIWYAQGLHLSFQDFFQTEADDSFFSFNDDINGICEDFVPHPIFECTKVICLCTENKDICASGVLLDRYVFELRIQERNNYF